MAYAQFTPAWVSVIVLSRWSSGDRKLYSSGGDSLRSTLIRVGSAGLLCLCWLAAPTNAYEEPPALFALVIGNQAYSQAPLDNTLNDARAVAKQLSIQGFEVTTLLNSGAAQ